jgi:outer membrane receptor for ferrienterochelin and colicin
MTAPIRRSIRFVPLILISSASAATVSPRADDSQYLTANSSAPPQVEPSTATPPPTAPTLDTVEIVGHSIETDTADRRDSTASKIVVPQDELLKFGATTLGDALGRLPGVTVSAGAAGSAGTISLRGLGSGYTQILLNGEKAPVGFSLESLTPDMVERIEILRAPTADQRTEAIAGTINIILKKLPKTDHHGLKLGLGSARGRLAPTASLQKSEAGDGLSYSLNGNLSRRDFLVTETDVQTGTDATAAPDLLRTDSLHVTGHNDAFSAAPSATLKLKGGDTLSVQSFLEATHQVKYGDASSNTLFGTPLLYASDTQFTDSKTTQVRTDLDWTHKFTPATQLDLKLSLIASRRYGIFKELGFAADLTPNLDYSVGSHVNDQGFNSKGKYSAPFAQDHALALGWEGGVSHRREDRIEHDTLVGLGLPGDSDMVFNARISRLALYAQDEWNATQRWSLYLGVRWEAIETVSEGNLFATIRNRARIVSPVAQSLWKLPGSERDQFRLALSRTYNSPPIASLIPRPFTSTNNTPLDPDTQGNPALRPELATGVDLAYEHYARNDAMVSIGSYVRRINDITRSNLALVEGRWVQSPFNGGNALAWGIEADGQMPLANLLAKAPPINISFNLTRNWSRVDELPGPNNRINNQIPVSGTLTTDYRINQHWSAGSSLSVKTGGPVRTTLATVANSSTYHELDTYALWKPTSNTKLRLSLTNLLREDLVTGSAYFDDTGTLVIVTRRVAPLNIRLDLEMSY